MREPPRLAGELPTVSVVIPTYRRREGLPEVVSPLLADPGTHEVIVVVDGSRDGSLELLDGIAATEPRLKPVFIENSGAMTARRIGVDRASGDVVLLLDDDVVAQPGMVSGHARRQARERGLVVVGYMPIRAPVRDRLGACTAELYARDYEQTCREYERRPHAVLYALWAGNVSLRRLDFLRVEGVSERSVAGYHADRDFGLRCVRAGLAGAFDRSLRAAHVYERGLDGFLRDARDSAESHLLVHESHADLIGRFTPSFEVGLPWPGRLLIRAGRRPAGRHAVSSGLHAVIRVGGALCSSYLQRNALLLLWRIEHRAALRSAHERLRAPRPRGSGPGLALPRAT